MRWNSFQLTRNGRVLGLSPEVEHSPTRGSHQQCEDASGSVLGVTEPMEWATPVIP